MKRKPSYLFRDSPGRDAWTTAGGRGFNRTTTGNRTRSDSGRIVENARECLCEDCGEQWVSRDWYSIECPICHTDTNVRILSK